MAFVVHSVRKVARFMLFQVFARLVDFAAQRALKCLRISGRFFLWSRPILARSNDLNVDINC